MIALLWNFSVAIRGYLRFYMPTNRALDWLRSPCGVKLAIPVALVAAFAYLYTMSVAAVIAAQPGLGWMNVLVVLCCWNALKFFWMAILFLCSVIGVVLLRRFAPSTSGRLVNKKLCGSADGTVSLSPSWTRRNQSQPEDRIGRWGSDVRALSACPNGSDGRA